MANAWRRADGYILVGVEEVRGGRSKIHGLQECEVVDDATVQQIVNKKVNRPLRFSCESHRHDDKLIWVIKIPLQERPFYLSKKLLGLREHAVFVRRGTSTDPTSPASPDEIAQMRLGPAESSPSIDVQLLREFEGSSIQPFSSCDTTNFEIPPTSAIPDLRQEYSPFGYRSPLDSLNADYYRECAESLRFLGLFVPSYLEVTNSSDSTARSLLLEISCDLPHSRLAIQDDKPREPRRSSLDISRSIPSLADRLNPDHPPIRRVHDGTSERLRIQFPDMQPGRTERSEKFYLSMTESGSTVINGRAFAENLSVPIDFQIDVDFSVSTKTIDLDEFLDVCNGNTPDSDR